MSRISFIVTIFILLNLQGSSQDTTGVSTLEEVVYTASKYPRKQTETGKVLSIISSRQLEQSYGRTLGEVLNTVAGTTIVGSNSNLGTNMTASIRGASAGNVLILLNGIPVNDPSVNDNYIDLNFFPIEQIERVEILKGGQSTLYGSDAVAGVINIITKKADRKGTSGNLSLSGGSYGTVKGNAGLNRWTDRSRLSLQYGYQRADGFSSAHDSTGKGDFERDGFRQHQVLGDWQTKLTAKLSGSLFGSYSWYKTGIDAGAFRDERDYTVTTDNLHTGGGLRYDIGDGALIFNYRYNTVDRLYLNDSVFGAPNYLKVDFRGGTHFAEVYGNKKWEHVELLTGVDYRRHTMSQDLLSVSSFGPYSSTLDDSLATMSQWSPYASVVIKPGRVFNLELGGRLNLHSEYGSNFSYTINPSVLLNRKVKAFVNLYSAFKTPTLYQLYEPMFGNRELRPEESFNVELGAQWFFAEGWNARAVYFHRNTDHSIEFIYTDPANYVSQYTNVSNKRANGWELEADYQGQRWNFSANYTYSRAELNTGYDNTGFPRGKDTVVNNLYRIPGSVLNVRGGWNVMKRLFAGLTLRVAGDRQEPVYGADPVKLQAYYTVDLYGQYGISDRVRLYADLKNLTDQRYFEIWGYNTRGINVMAGIQVRL